MGAFYFRSKISRLALSLFIAQTIHAKTDSSDGKFFQSYSDASGDNDHKGEKCPDLLGYSQMLDAVKTELDGKKVADLVAANTPIKALTDHSTELTCGKAYKPTATTPGANLQNGLPSFNLELIRAMATVPPGGSYSFFKKGMAQATDQQINICGSPATQPAHKFGSYCSGGPYTAVLTALNLSGAMEKVCQGGNGEELAQKLSESSDFFETANNDHIQFGDMVGSDVLDLGTVISPEHDKTLKKGSEQDTVNGILDQSCPGDILSFGRNSKNTGHTGMYLGRDSSGNVYYWSSNSASHGWGVDCYPSSDMSSDDFSISRIEKPENINNVVLKSSALKTAKTGSTPQAGGERKKNLGINSDIDHK